MEELILKGSSLRKAPFNARRSASDPFSSSQPPPACRPVHHLPHCRYLVSDISLHCCVPFVRSPDAHLTWRPNLLFTPPPLPIQTQMAPRFLKLFFVPGLHRINAAPSARPIHAVPNPNVFCPSSSRHATVNPPKPARTGRIRRVNAPRGSRAAPQSVIAPLASAVALRSTLPGTQPAVTTLLPPGVTPKASGHKHTAESKRKISDANRGNVPWNKGRKHSEETKRKISEGTRRAMLQPAMRRLLKERAKGRKHSEATKLKIRETARASRGGITAIRKQKRQPVPFSFPESVVADLNAKVQHQLEKSYTLSESQHLVVREKRPMLEETKAKLSARIKELWSDPDYRNKVAEGIESRAQRVGRTTSQPSSPRASRASSPRPAKPKKEPRPPKSPRRRSRPKPRKVAPKDKKSAYHDDIDSSEIFLEPESLDGITKEDLGLFVPLSEGQINVTAAKEQAFANTSAASPDALFSDISLQDPHGLFDSPAHAERALGCESSDVIDSFNDEHGCSKLESEIAIKQPYLFDPALPNSSLEDLALPSTEAAYPYEATRPQFLGLLDMPSPSGTVPIAALAPYPSVGQTVYPEWTSPEIQFNTDLAHFDEDQVMSHEVRATSVPDELFCRSVDSNSNNTGAFDSLEEGHSG